MKVVIVTNYPEGETEEFDAINHPENDPSMGTRKVPFGRKELYIERDDFIARIRRNKFHRMGPGREVRLRYAYLVTCTDVVERDDDWRGHRGAALHLRPGDPRRRHPGRP